MSIGVIKHNKLGRRRQPSRAPGTLDADGEPWAAPGCKGCSGHAAYNPGGGWKHQFTHCEVRVAQLSAARAKEAGRRPAGRRP